MSTTPVTRRSALTLIGFTGLLLLAVLLGRPAFASSSELQQPHMRMALVSLREARHHLDEATADKGGHRAKAIELVNSAIAETEAGIAYAATH